MDGVFENIILVKICFLWETVTKLYSIFSLVFMFQEEITPPEIQQLLLHCGGGFSKEQVKQLERMMLLAVRFELVVPTSQFFLEYFASKCISNFDGFHADKLRCEK